MAKDKAIKRRRGSTKHPYDRSKLLAERMLGLDDALGA